MPQYVIPLVITGIMLSMMAVGFAILFVRSYRKVEQGRALIINKVRKEPNVTFTGGLVLPIFHRAEVMDISVKTIEIDRRGKEGLICKDNIRADIKVTFFVKVNKAKEHVLKVAQQVGCARASDQDTLEELFQAKFSEALKTVGKQLDFVELYTQRDDFRDQIIREIGENLNGYSLEDAAIDYLEQTPVEALDKDNILDAQGIRKITELTATQNVQTNELRQAERKAITKQDVEAEEAVLALKRQEADAIAKQHREIATMQAREQAETKKVQAEEYRKAQVAQLKAEEEVKVSEVRAIAEAKRNKEVAVTGAEAEAQEGLVKEIKAAEAQQQVAVFAAKEKLTLADAELEASDRKAKAKIRLAEGVQAEEAATGLAKVRVKEADAVAIEKEGTAQAKVIQEKLEANARGEEQQGLAQARVREAEAIALEKMGLAEAIAIEKKLSAEAIGLKKKADAMKALDGVGREHEEFRIRLEKDKEVELATLNVRRDIADSRAQILKEAFDQAKINIVGGDGQFFERFINAVSVGQSVDGFFDNSTKVQNLLGDYLNGQASLPEELLQTLQNTNISTKDLQNLSVSAFLGKMMLNADEPMKTKLENLLNKAKELGVDKTSN